MTKSRLVLLSLVSFTLTVLLFNKGHEARQVGSQVHTSGGEIVRISPVTSGEPSVALPERQAIAVDGGSQTNGLPERTFGAPSQGSQGSQIPELTRSDISARTQSSGASESLPERIGISATGQPITTAGGAR